MPYRSLYCCFAAAGASSSGRLWMCGSSGRASGSCSRRAMYHKPDDAGPSPCADRTIHNSVPDCIRSRFRWPCVHSSSMHFGFRS
uniref:Putative secreted protein n=1 Tax=Anopheles triannulatus TaxID=58253 RepID=A0A2M4B5V2_9DIPT